MRRILLAGCMSAALLGGSYTIVNTETTTLLAAMDVQPDMRRTIIIDTFIGALKTAGVWSKLDLLYVLAAHAEQAGRLNWVSPGSFTLTAVNTVTFTADRGFAGDGSSGYLDTGWDRPTNGVQYTQNSAHISVYQRNTGNNNVETFADFAPGPRVSIGARGVNTTGGGTLVNTATRLNGPASGSQPMHAIGRRPDSANVSLVRDGVEVATAAIASAAMGTNDLCFGRGGSYTSAQVALGSVGAYLDDTECAAFYAACNAYMVAVGADT